MPIIFAQAIMFVLIIGGQIFKDSTVGQWLVANFEIVCLDYTIQYSLWNIDNKFYIFLYSYYCTYK